MRNSRKEKRVRWNQLTAAQQTDATNRGWGADRLMRFVINDGGRLNAGFHGNAGDCVTRAIVIASGRPYLEVYNRLASENAGQRKTKLRRSKAALGVRTAQHGITTTRQWFKQYMIELGAEWFPTMGIGTGCQVHLREEELPGGRIVVKLSRHSAAVIDRVLHDTYDCSRGGTRCVYGYWKFPRLSTDPTWI